MNFTREWGKEIVLNRKTFLQEKTLNIKENKTTFKRYFNFV